MIRFLWLPIIALAGCGAPPASDEPREVAPLLAYDGASVTQANERVLHGKRLSLVLGCTGCHGDELRGEPFREQKGFGSLYASNLTRRVPRYTDEQLERRCAADGDQTAVTCSHAVGNVRSFERARHGRADRLFAYP